MAKNKFHAWIVMEDGSRLAVAKSGAFAYVRGTAAERDAHLVYAALANAVVTYADLTTFTDIRTPGHPEYQEDDALANSAFVHFRDVLLNAAAYRYPTIHFLNWAEMELPAFAVFRPWARTVRRRMSDRYQRRWHLPRMIGEEAHGTQ